MKPRDSSNFGTDAPEKPRKIGARLLGRGRDGPIVSEAFGTARSSIDARIDVEVDRIDD